ncbi:hypothetical protein BH20ACT5_BH20ACT5_17400 [soil metagenome]
MLAVRGYQAQADRVTRLLATAPTLEPAAASAYEQAVRITGEQLAPPEPITPAQPAAAAIGSVLHAMLDAVRASTPGTIADIDTEFLHDVRVAVRRARSVLKLTGDVLPPEVTTELAAELRWLGDVTSPTRDLDVYLLGVPAMARGLRSAEPGDLDEFGVHLAQRRRIERRRLVRALRSKRFASLVGLWQSVPRQAPHDGPTASALAAERVRRAHRRVVRLGSAITVGSPAEDLHTLRKRCKELRYLLEIFEPCYDRTTHRQAMRTLRSLQDCLGRFQDNEVQADGIGSFRGRDDGRRHGRAADPAGDGRSRRRATGRAAACPGGVRRGVRRVRPAEEPPPGRGGMKVIACYTIKGGVGKTSTAVNLAHLAARDGQRTLLWDLDPQGAASFLFRIKPRVKGGGKALVRRRTTLDDAIKGTDFDDLDLLPADFSYRHMDLHLDAGKDATRALRKLLRPLAGEYDVVFLDCPPGISLVSEAVMHAADLLLVPLIPATLSLRTFDQLTAFVADFEGRRPALLAFFSMVDRRRRLHREVVDDVAGSRREIAGAVIPALSAIEQMAEVRVPTTAAHPRSRAAQSYASLWAEAQGALGSKAQGALGTTAQGSR